LLELSALGLLLGFVLVVKATNPDTFTDDLAALGVFAIAMVQILPSLNTFGGTRLQIMTGLPNVQIAHDILTKSVPARKEGHREIGPLENAIAFEGVSFAHRERETLMDRVDMSFERGSVTAIVGPSGSGKTTLINLILGLFEPTEGEITVDGVPLQDLTHDTWLGRIGFVSQDPFIYNTTIEENIRFSRSGHSTEDIIQAATIANAHGFINELPLGYDTVVGDRGLKMSGGQQQRLCIARAVLATPEILIFDEATSSLDSLSEKLVQEAIDNASAERTVIIIAHRLSTIRHADKIIVLDHGQVVEQGTHQELLGSKGHYSRQVAATT
jgi:ABC-type multidrug transport system fused ATPase/permease subunit